MNVVKIMGGLGNQLFGYAFAKHLERCGPVGLDLSWFDSEDNQGKRFPKRQFLLDRFTTDFQIVKPEQYKLSLVREENYNPTSNYDNGYFWGYWQRGSYSKDLDLDIRLLDEYVTDNIKFLAEELQNQNSVAIHVRRTDYAQFDNWLLDKTYYDAAMKKMIKLVDDPVFYFFSDDPDWCIGNFAEIPLHGDELTDFYLMQHCKHNIIANSTYSFWAAMLNKNPDKVVVYPSDWKCGQEPVDFEGWVKI